ncbi:MAG: hypothetical protein ABSF83_11880 [Nitrososphaerales archaeon]
MVEIEYLPYQKIIVHEATKVEIGELLTIVAAQVEAQKQGGSPEIRWVDGLALLIGEFIVTPEIIAEQLQGRIHYSAIWFAETSYQAEKRVTVNNREYSIRLIKADKNPNLVALVKFLKGLHPAQEASTETTA